MAALICLYDSCPVSKSRTCLIAKGGSSDWYGFPLSVLIGVLCSEIHKDLLFGQPFT